MIRVYVVRRGDGKYFQGCGYGGPGHPVPYWTEDVRKALSYRTVVGAAKAAKQHGGYAGAAAADSEGAPKEWLGFLVRRLNDMRTVLADPRDFDPNDYEGNNGPL